MNECVQVHTSRIVSRKEKGRKIEIVNREGKRVEIGKVDGCLIVDENIEKCDYYVQVEDDAIYYVEMKGSDLEKAIRQVLSGCQLLVGKKGIPRKRD